MNPKPTRTWPTRPVHGRTGRAALAWTSSTIVALASFACDSPQPARLDPAASLLVAAPPVAVGNPFEVTLFVRTPIGHRVHGYEVPALESLQIIERHTVPTTETDTTSIHRETLVARTLDTGRANWPPSEVHVTRPSGETYALSLEGLEFEVPSVFGETSPPPRPRGYRPAPSRRSTGSFVQGFAAGAFAGLLLALAWTRRRRKPGGPAQDQAASKPRSHFGGPTRLAAELDSARARIDIDPDGAASAASLALRHWAADRYLVSTHASSLEELRTHIPHDGPRVEWRAWTDALAQIEAARFDAMHMDARMAVIRQAIERARTFAHSLQRPATGSRSR